MNKPKCVITGSAQGLGLAIRNRFESEFDITEYDLQYGQDLNQSTVRDQLIEDLKDSTIFFNNAHGVFQEELTERAFDLQNDLVIVVSNSSVTYYDDNSEWMQDPGWAQYVSIKKSLTAKIRELHNRQGYDRDLRAWLINIRMNWLDTEQHRWFEHSKLDCEHVVDLMELLLQSWPNLAVQDLLVMKPNLTGKPYRSQLENSLTEIKNSVD